MKNAHNKSVHFYSKVGKPELVFFITLSAVVFLPFVVNLDHTIVPQILLSLFLFSVQFLIKVSGSKFKKYLNVFLLLIVVIIWIQYFKSSIPIYILSISEIFLMIISFYFISKSIFNTSEVDVNTLIAAISGYLLIGISMSIVVSIMQTFNNNSFSFTGEVTSFESYYYSFVTLSTLGYGDVLPLSKSAKGLSIIITLIGQFYMVIVMGLIIGKLLYRKENNK